MAMRIKIIISDDCGNEAGWTSLKNIESPTSNIVDHPPTVKSVLESIVADATSRGVFVFPEEAGIA